MNPKVILTALLLGFVGISLGMVAVKELRSPGPAQAAMAPAGSSGAASPAADGQPRIVAYYFHGSARCYTCNAIQARTEEAITANFVTAHDADRVDWRIVDVSRPENRRYIDEFQLAFQSVILAEEEGGRTVRWQNLADVWRKVHGSPVDFEAYIVDNMLAFMADSGT